MKHLATPQLILEDKLISLRMVHYVSPVERINLVQKASKVVNSGTVELPKQDTTDSQIRLRSS